MLLESITLFQIRVVEESQEQQAVSEINAERKIQILVRLLAKFASRFGTLHFHIDYATDHHLQNLHSRYGHWNPFRETPAARAQGVV